MNVSCANPLGTVLGIVAVVSSVETAVAFNALLAQPTFSLTNFQEWLYRKENLVQAAVGLVAFKVLGGKFRNLMPSDVRYPGALARVSIPARGISYANDVQKAIVADLFKQFGCHHCGKRTGESISDHMPPNVIVHGPRKLLINSKNLQKTDEAAGQRFYPQCRDCIKLQSTALRHGGRRLVLHWKRGWPEPFYYSGFFLGSAHLYDPESKGLDKTPAFHISPPHGQSVNLVRRSLEELGPAHLQTIQDEIERLRRRDKQLKAEVKRILQEKSLVRFGAWGVVRAGSEEQLALTKLHTDLKRNAELKGKLKDDLRWLKGQIRRT